MNLAAVQSVHMQQGLCVATGRFSLCVQEFANLPDWVTSRANDQVAWLNTLVGHVWHVAGAGGGAGEGAGAREGGTGAGTGGDLTHRLLSRLEPAVRVSKHGFKPHTISVLSSLP